MSTFIAQVFYKDTMAIYRGTTRDADGDWQDPTLVTGLGAVPCNLHSTDNYDKNLSPAGMSKVQNIMTSDKVTFGTGYDIQPEDWVKVTRRTGAVEWYRLAGAIKTRTLLDFCFAYLTITGDPTA